MAEQTDDALKSIRDSDLDAFTTGLAFDSQKISEDTRNAFENSENFETVQESIKKPYSPARRKTIEEAVDKEVGEAAEAAAAKILDAAEAKEQEEFDIGSLPSKITEVTVERYAEVKKIEQQKSPKSPASQSETQEDGPKESSGFELVSAIKNFMVPEQEETETKKTEREQNTKNQEDDREALLSSSTVEALAARKSANTSSLSLLAAQYNSDSGGESDAEPSKKQEGPVKKPEKATAEKPADYRDVEDDSDSSSSSDSDVEFISHQQISNELAKIIDVDMLEEEEENTGKPKVPIKAKGELLLEDLPPIQDLHITVPEYECVELGKVNSIVDQLVLVDSIPGTVPLNLDTVLFLEKGSKVLGEVFDVLGQVSNPLYCVRFNSNAHIKEKGIEIGQTVYVAPRSDHTKYVILPEILKLRGSDASWENDIEPSDKHLDYSDDEDERVARRSGGRSRDRPDEGDAPKRRRPTAAEQQQARSHHQYPRYQPRNPSQDRGGGGGGNILGGGQYQPFPPQPPMATVPPPFAYNSASGSWHANYNQPPVFYPNPYARGPPFIPPEAMQQVLFPPPPPPGEQ